MNTRVPSRPQNPAGLVTRPPPHSSLWTDYVVHIAHAFTHSHRAGAAERARAAIGDLGISVVSGGVTSICASVPLLFCNMQFFGKFGIFMITLVGCSFLSATVGLIAILVTFGPDQGQGDLDWSFLTGKESAGGPGLEVG